MGPRTRRRVPAVEEEALFRADHTCCVCREKGKPVQVHHIDGNPSNNDPDNLAVVCLECHSRITGTGGLGRAYTPGEVRRYKRAWDHQVEQSRGMHKPRIGYRKELVSQIDLIVCEILACGPNDPRIETLLDVLTHLHVWRGGREIDSKIIEGLGHLALMGGVSDPRLAALLPQTIWAMCWHFMGPEHLPMSKEGLAQVLGCIDVLATLADCNCGCGHGRKAIREIAIYAETFRGRAVVLREAHCERGNARLCRGPQRLLLGRRT